MFVVTGNLRGWNIHRGFNLIPNSSKSEFVLLDANEGLHHDVITRVHDSPYQRSGDSDADVSDFKCLLTRLKRT
jgi:hypothetical protein